MTALGCPVRPDPDRFTAPPDDEDFNASMQALGDAQVLVEYCICQGRVEVRGAWINGELVDADEFKDPRLEFWRHSIQCEFDHERAGDMQ